MIEGTNSNYAYTYDSMGRLLTLTRDGTLMEEYQYDSVGRRSYEMNVQKGISGRTFTYSDEDHLITTGDVTYQYDADGFLTTKTHGSDIAHYSYSSRGELLSVSLPDGTVIEYVNDPLGRRIAKRVNGVITEKYLWQGLTRLLAVYDGTNNLIMRFEYADGRMPVAMTIGGATYYLIYNQVGSLRIVADASGNAVKRLDYDSFGNIISEPNPGFLVPFGFASGLHDRDTGLVRFGFRDYDPQVGRWTAKDPIYFAGGDTDLYGYVLSNPIGLVDPSGLDACGNFIDALIRDCVASKDIGDLGKTFLEKRATTLKDVSGFRTELVSGGQRGGVSRHIYGHAGAILRYGRYGLAVSYFQEGIDYFQRFQEDRTKEESEAEIAGDRAARDIARVLRSAKEAGACSKKEPREGLKQILCQ
jgi:RHS repeat-associated protein